MNSSVSSPASRTIHGNNEEPVTITEKIKLTKNQYEVLNIICNTYEESVSKYLQDALIEAMRFDIEEGNFPDVLLQKITDKEKEEKNKSPVNKERKRNSFLRESSVDNSIGTGLQF
jgi:hypothetical protein